MSLGPVRPRFRMVLPGKVEQHIARVEDAVGQPENRCVARVLGNHIDIAVISEDRHRWSPCVQMELEQSDEQTIVRGLIGPHPNTWTLFAFINITLGIIGVFGLMGAVAQLTLQQTPWILWSVLICLCLLAVMYVASQIGRRLAGEQTRQLIKVVEDALSTALPADTLDGEPAAR